MTTYEGIYFEDYHRDGMDKVVEATEDEWEALIAPAVAGKHPIDGSWTGSCSTRSTNDPTST